MEVMGMVTVAVMMIQVLETMRYKTVLTAKSWERECVNDESDDESPQGSDSNDEPPESSIPDDSNPADTPPPAGDGTNSNLEGAGESPETLSTSSEQETGDGFLTISTHTDGDGVSDDQDADDDNNGLPDNAEVDTDRDGIPNDQAPDDNGNAIDDEVEDIDGDGITNDLDADDDNDGIPNDEDTDDDFDGVLDEDEPSTDGDGTIDDQDTDDDNDGIVDSQELDSDFDGEINDFDTDDDGIPDNEDTDADNDGFQIVTFRFLPRTTISACPRLVLALWQVQWTIFNSRKYRPSYFDSWDCLLTRIWNQKSHYSQLNILAHVR